MRDRVSLYRAQFRREEIGARYSGPAHLALTSGCCLAVIIGCALQLHAVTPLQWLTVPATFVYANLAEYFGHRGPMHHPRRGLRLIFHRHTEQHHRFFTHQRMPFDSARDYKAVLFPPVMLLFFFGGFGTPVGLLLGLLLSANVGWLFALTATAYFLNYELLHFCYHTRPDSWIARLPGMETLRRLHTTHHDPSLMTHHNFNITYPIGDYLFGTLWGRQRVATATTEPPT